MSRKTKKKKKNAETPPAPTRRRAPLKAAVLAAAACVLLGAAFAATRFAPVRRAVGLRPLPAPAAQATPATTLAKEYIYAGGRLVATEEPAAVATPTPTPAGTPPTNLVATLTSAAAPAASIHVSWDAPAGNVMSYIVERASAVGQFQPVGQPVPASSTVFEDAGDLEGAAYLYRVRAVFAGGGTSGYSNVDLATAVAFTDDPLVGANDPENRPATTIYARHLTELRRAVSAVHVLAGLGSVTTWTHPDPVSSPPAQRRLIYLEDVQDLRVRLGEALPALERTPPSYVDLTLNRRVTHVKKEHIQQLRDAVK